MALVLGCACDVGNGNTGLLNCQELFGLSNGMIIQPIVADDMALNSFDISATLGTTFKDALTDADRTKRLYPITGMRNFDFPKEETQYETDNTGQKEPIRDGIQSVVGEKWKVSNVFYSKLRQGRCSRNGTYILTDNGVVGVRVGDDWSPIEMSAYDVQYMFKKGDANSKVQVNFDFSSTVDVGQLWMMSYADLGVTYNELIGLLDGNFNEVVVPTIAALNTELVYELRTDYGSGLVNNQTIDGQVITDFALFNNTTQLSVSLTSVVETADVSYKFVYVTLPNVATDSMTLSFVTASGFEGSITYLQP